MRRPPAIFRLLLAVILAGTGLSQFAGRAQALFADTASASDSAFTTLTLGAPSGLAANAQGHDVQLSWQAGQHGTGYAVLGVANGGSSDCSSALFASVGTTAGTSYTDSGRYAPQGTWFCYQVQTTREQWTSLSSNPTAAVQLGFVATTLQVINGGDTAGCSGWQSGAAGDLDCGDQVVVSFNQAVDTATGPSGTDTICAHDLSDTLWLASSTASGDCTASESVALGKLTGSSLGACDCRFNLSYAWAADSRTLTVTVGARVSGSAYPSLGGTLWTFTPTTDTAKLLSASGAVHVCDADVDGSNCLPESN